MAAITGLAVVNDIHGTPEGYKMIEKDLNNGAGGKYVYLCYSTLPGIGPPITAIQVASSSKNQTVDQSLTPPGFRLIANDLCNGTGGDKYIYISYASGTTAMPITAVDVIIGGSYNIWPSKEFVKINQDCNEGSGGNFVFICYKY